MSAPFELSVTRLIKAAPGTVWTVYVERTRDWFCPRPWTTPVVDWDLRPGGRCNVVMQSPQGEQHPYQGVFLDVEHGRRLVSTGTMTEGWIPQAGDINFVHVVTLEPEDGGTRYTASARHWDEAAMQAHREMGFDEGWAAVAEQLAELAEKQERTAP